MKRLFIHSALMLLSIAGAAHATEFRPGGGEGGDAYRQTCPQGAYLVGVNAFTGDWVDRMQIACATLNDGAMGHPYTLPQFIGSSPGGAPNNAYCANGSVVTRIDPLFTRKRGDYVGFLDDLSLSCADVLSGQIGQGAAYAPLLHTGGTGNFWSSPMTFSQQCPAGEFAIGLHGRAGLFIDSLGLICGAAPQSSAPGVALGRAIQRTPAQRALSRAAAGTQGTTAAGAVAVGRSQNANIPGPAAQTQMRSGGRVGATLPAPPAGVGQPMEPVQSPVQPQPNPPREPAANGARFPRLPHKPADPDPQPAPRPGENP